MNRHRRRPIVSAALITALAVGVASTIHAQTASESSDSSFTIARVEVEGHAAMSTRQILQMMALGSGDRVSPGELKRRLEGVLLQYRDMGFPKAEIQVSGSTVLDGRREVRLEVNEGPRLPIGSLWLQGCNGVPCSVLESLMDTREGALFRGTTFEDDVDRLLDEYALRGYPYAHIRPRPTWSESEGIRVRLEIDEGPEVVFDRVHTRGNKSTRDDVIEREAGIRAGDVYSQRKIDRVDDRLLRLGFFEEVSSSVRLLDDSGKAVLDIEVRERKTNTLYGAVGYVPKDPKGYLTGVLDLAFGNIAGTGRSASVRWRTYQPQAFEWTFGYGEPWVLGIPLMAGISIHQEVRDSTFTKTDGEIAFEYPLGDVFWARVEGRTEGVVAGSGGKDVVRGSRRRMVDVGARWDLRDDPLNPSRGWNAALGVAYGRKRYEGEDDPIQAAVYRTRADAFLPVGLRQVIAVMSSARILDTSERDIPQHEQFDVGGAESLRGYGEDAFFGYRVVTLGGEYRVLLGRRSRIHAFVDGAWLRRRLPGAGGAIEEEEKWLFGYGFGIRSESRLGMVGVDFGLATGEPLTEGKIHLRLEGEF